MVSPIRVAVRLTFVVLLVLIAGLPSPAQANVTGIIYASDMSTGEALAMSPVDGTIIERFQCFGDVSHGGSPRSVLITLNSGDALQLGSPSDVPAAGYWMRHADLYVSSESQLTTATDCAAGDLIYSDPSMYMWGPAKWSLDGRRVAFGGARESGGTLTDGGVYVGELVVDPLTGDRSLQDVRRAVELSVGVVPQWARDNRHVAYYFNVGSSGDPRYDLFVADLDTGAANNITNSTTQEWTPTFSPTSDTLAFKRRDAKGRDDIYALSIDLNTLTASGLRPITKRKTCNAANIGYPAWSPDGNYIAFRASAPSLIGDDIWRIRADGSQKAVNLTSASDIWFAPPSWRA